MGNAAKQISVKPDVYSYDNFRKFLNDWLEYKAQTERKFSLRHFSSKCGVSVSMLSRILNGKSTLSVNNLNKLKTHLELNKVELEFFKCLINLNDAVSQEDREQALSELFTFPKYRKFHKQENSSYMYLNNWHYPAICTLTELPDFKEDPKWIKKQLGNRLSLVDTRDALFFLKQNGFLVYNNKGVLEPAEKELVCSPGIFSVSMASYYKQMFSLAGESYYVDSKENRRLRGHTVAITKSEFEEISEAIIGVSEKIKEISTRPRDTEAVYQICMAAFPLVGKDGDQDEK